MFRRLRKPILVVVLAGFVVALACSCEAPYRPMPYVPRAAVAPEPLVCHDAVGHIRGNKPWILGGNCCCTPTRENYDLHVKGGTLDRSTTYEQYLKRYRDRGIVTNLDHTGCGNLCAQGPHVMLGGKCMATPTPGTGMYEAITFGPHANLVRPEAANPARTASAGVPSG